MKLAPVLLLSLGLGGCGDPVVVRVDGSAGVIPLLAGLARAYAQTGTRDSITIGDGLGSRARGLVVREIAQGAVVFGTHGGVILAGLSEAQVSQSCPRCAPASEVDAEVALDQVASRKTLTPGAIGLLRDADCAGPLRWRIPGS